MLYNHTSFSNRKINGVSVDPTSKLNTSRLLLQSGSSRAPRCCVFQWNNAYSTLTEICHLLQNFKGRKHAYKHIHTVHDHRSYCILPFSGRKGGKSNNTVSLYIRKVYGKRKWRYSVVSFGSWWN